MTYFKQVDYGDPIPQSKINNLSKKVANSMQLDDEIALSLIYNEIEKVELLFKKHKKIKTVHKHLMKEIDGHYRR